MIDKNKVKQHFNQIAQNYDRYKTQNYHYYNEIKKLLNKMVQSIETNYVLEIGCGTGNLLELLRGKFVLGGDISIKMIKHALNKKNTSTGTIRYVAMAAEELPLKPVFDFIFSIDLMEHVNDPHQVLAEIRSCAGINAKILIISANPLWSPFLHYAEKKHLKMPEGPHKWRSLPYLIRTSINLGYTVIDHGYRYPFPFPAGFFSDFINRVLQGLPLIKRLGLIQYLLLGL